ncbi:MAG: sporulation transcriptional regulator SpoIIID [Acutalibacteraceae bacterium]
MRESVEERPVILGKYIVDTGATVRVCAKRYGISKSTVHKDVSDRLKGLDEELYYKVKKVLEINKAERHIRGGIATKNKYLNKNK